MNSISINNIINSTERYKLFLLDCNAIDLAANISFFENGNINTINIGKELAVYIEKIQESKYLNIEVYDFLKKLFDNKKATVNNSRNPVLGIYNLGILLEPKLELNATKLISEFSKSTSLIIIWENESDYTDVLNFKTQQNKYFFDFSEVKLKRLQHEI